MRQKFFIFNQYVFGGFLLVVCAFCLTTKTFAAGVSLSATPNTQTVSVGQTATYTININRDGYTDKVTLSATGLPANTTATFTPNTTTATSSTLKLQTAANTPLGIFNINVKGTANGITIAPITVKLTTTAAQSISILTLPESQSIIAGQSTYYDIRINRTGFSGAVVLSAENVPSGVSVIFEPQETTGNTARMWLYSGGLPPIVQSYGMNVVAKRLGFDVPRDLKPVRLNVNCDMVWSEQGFPELNTADFATAVTSDSMGNVYTAGHFFPTGNTQEIWVAKYSPSGGKFWVRTVTINNVVGLEKRAKAIAVNSAGQIYVGGYTLTTNPQFQDYDAFIAKFDTNGNQLGNLVFGTNRYEDGAGGMEIRFDTLGNPLLTGTFDVRRTNFGDPMLGNFTQTNFDIGRVTFDANLTSFFNQSVVLDNYGEPKDVTVGSDGTIYVVGTDLDIPSNPTVANPPFYFGFAKKFTTGGGQLFNIRFTREHFPQRVAADTSGNALVGGIIRRSNSNDVWIAKLNPQGTQQWITFDATNTDEAIGDVVTDASGNLIYGGSTKGNLAATNPDTNSDAYLAKRNGTTGTLIFMRQFPVADKDNFESISLDNAGNVLLAGNTVIFNNVRFGSEDVLLIKYSLTGIPIFPPFITRPNPASVRGGTQFTIEGGNFYGVQAIFFDGQPLQFTVVSPSRITATAPTVTMSRTGNLTISANCHQHNSPVQLTVTP